MSDSLSNPGPEMPETLRKVYEILEGSPVLLAIPKGEKGPQFSGWQKLTFAQSRDPKHRVQEYRSATPAELATGAKDRVKNGGTRPYPELLDERAQGGNLGVLLGCSSILEDATEKKTYHLCAIDIDDSEAVEPFLAANPKLAFSLRIVGQRGCKIFVWIDVLAGPYQDRKVPLSFLGPDGKPVAKKDVEHMRHWGEWLATGSQAVIYGLHPHGMRYEATVKKPPARIAFSDIVWPEGVHIPWLTDREQPTEDQKAQAEHDELCAQYGDPWTISNKGKVTLNQTYFAAFFAKKHRILYSPEEARFFRYQGDQSGLWAKQTKENVGWELAADMKTIADDSKLKPLINARTTSFEDAVITKLKGAVERWKAFERARNPANNRPRALIHLKNTMLDLDADPPAPLAFSHEFMSRTQLNVALDPEAKCPRFQKELIDPAIPNRDDQILLQKFAGQFLLGVNLSQMFLILTGTAGGGKSTFVNIISGIIGDENVGELRTEHLHKQFEIYEAVNKTLLIGVDVPGGFLMSEGAYKIKGLVGGDSLTAEPKHGNERIKVKGEVNILITANTRLKVRGDNDWDAWRRRMSIIDYKCPPPATPDPSFVQKILASEASGILNWQIEGAVMLLDDLATGGRMVLSAEQKTRVNSLLAESDSVRDFVKNGLRKNSGHKLTSDQISAAYIAYCERRGWQPMPTSIVERQLPDALLETHGATKANDIKETEEGKNKRGYRGVEIVHEVLEEPK